MYAPQIYNILCFEHGNRRSIKYVGLDFLLHRHKKRRFLCKFIKEYSKEIGCSEMFLITDKGNPRACHVYEKLGGKNDYKDEIVYVYDYEKGDK